MRTPPFCKDLQMLTGSNSTDIDYLYYLLVMEGTYANSIIVLNEDSYDSVDVVDDLEDMFDD